MNRLTKLYANILLNLEYLSPKELKVQLKDLQLEFCALTLKYRFNDNRTIPVLKALIIEEFKLI